MQALAEQMNWLGQVWGAGGTHAPALQELCPTKLVPEHVGPLPFVQPGAPWSPSAFDHPPEYHAQSMPAPLSRSPMVGFVRGGSYAAVGLL